MKNNAGISILGLLILAVIVVLVLGYFHISIKAVVENPTSQDNINYVGGGARSLWLTYLEAPFTYFWNEIVIKIFWKSFINNMERIRDGQPTDLDKAGNNLGVPH